MNPSDLGWWEWLICGALCGVAVPVFREFADEFEGNLGLLAYIFSLALQIVTIILILIGIVCFVK
jgi:hypothetical protein